MSSTFKVGKTETIRFRTGGRTTYSAVVEAGTLSRYSAARTAFGRVAIVAAAIDRATEVVEHFSGCGATLPSSDDVMRPEQIARRGRPAILAAISDGYQPFMA